VIRVSVAQKNKRPAPRSRPFLLKRMYLFMPVFRQKNEKDKNQEKVF
jgi:hypothetical protein